MACGCVVCEGILVHLLVVLTHGPIVDAGANRATTAHAYCILLVYRTFRFFSPEAPRVGATKSRDMHSTGAAGSSSLF